jgi:WD40 repeat protein
MARFLGCLVLLAIITLTLVHPVGSEKRVANAKPDREKKKVVAVGSADGAVHVWEAGSGKSRLHFGVQDEESAPSGNGPVSLVFTLDGSKLILAAGGRVSLWDAVTGKPLHHFTRIATPDEEQAEELRLDHMFPRKQGPTDPPQSAVISHTG